jgi:LPPG:FO 2-phospho-L-lactate transferase
MIVVLTGGTGGAKLIQGLVQESDPTAVTIICNTADDFVLHGLNISPDLDTIMYTLAGVNDPVKGWGIAADTFTVLAQLKRLGAETWFNLGDKDLATHMVRTAQLREGVSLSEVTKNLAGTFGIKATILPMSNDRVETRVVAEGGEISFQEYFVKHRWQPQVKRVFYAAIEKARPAPEVLECIRRATQIIICPSNPITSIGPIIAVPGIRDAIKESRASVIAISPMIGDSAISGPAHKLMKAAGSEPSALGIAKLYGDFLDTLFIDIADEMLSERVQRLNIRAVATSIRMDSNSDKSRLAREILALIHE